MKHETPDGIAEEKYLKLGGLDQWVVDEAAEFNAAMVEVVRPVVTSGAPSRAA